MHERSKYIPVIGPGVSLGESIALTDEVIKNVVYQFYGKIQKDEVLGPIFEAEMTEGWDEHLPKMVNFWTTIMFGKELYHGNPLIAHARVPSISLDHFQRWLNLFDETLQEVCADPRHAAAFNLKANNMRAAMTRALGLVSANW